MTLRSRRSILVVSTVLLAAGLLVARARRNRDAPARCAPGLLPSGARCCPEGQTAIDGICRGNAVACPEDMELWREATGYCSAVARRVHIAAGALHAGASDWEAPDSDAHGDAVAAFYLDSIEFTWKRYLDCVAARRCARIDDLRASNGDEPGLPLGGVTPAQAEALCRAEGGRLPRGEEWLLAAAGTEGRRFPWGPNGLVCRRAAFGLVRGPCAEGGARPELAGARADGRSDVGVYDLVGNVAEWTREPEGYAARGGSYRSELVSDLKSSSRESTETAAPHIGFRCAYDNP